MPGRRVPFSGFAAVFALAGSVAAAFSHQSNSSVVVLVGSDVQGRLAPCGCTSPMTGGIRRLATAVAAYRGTDGIFLENGGLIDENPPNGLVGIKQNAIKARAIADALRAMHVDAVNVGQEEIQAGRGTLEEIVQLTDHATVSTSLEAGPTDRLARWIARGPFLIGGITPASGALAATMGGSAVPPERAARELADEASRRGLTPILLYRGGEGDAAALARAAPELALIVYKSGGSASLTPETVGRTLLVTPGDHAKSLAKLEFEGGRFSNYRAVDLSPDFADEPTVSRYYRDYLHEVDRAKLIEQLDRQKTSPFAGSKSCMSCHAAAYKKWKGSAHFHALADLERQGHSRDPDCLSCHVTGLASTLGFRSRTQTPTLANVTCEACHGPAKAHVFSPRAYRLPKLSPSSCVHCHSPENSPNFSFARMWPKISHR